MCVVPKLPRAALGGLEFGICGLYYRNQLEAELIGNNDNLLLSYYV